LEKSLLGFVTVLDIINDEDVEDVLLLVVNGVVSSVVLVVGAGGSVCLEIVVLDSVVGTEATGLKV